MNLKDCSKEELIYLIKTYVFMDEISLEKSVLLYRISNVLDKESDELEKSRNLLGKYIELIESYKNTEMPRNITKKIIDCWNRRQRHIDAAEKCRKQYEGCRRRLEKIKKMQQEDPFAW